MIELLNYLSVNTTRDEFNEILNIVTDDIKFNNINFSKFTNFKKLAELCQATYKLVTRKDMLWIKVCTSCGYSTWSLKYNTKCTKCGGISKCENTR